MADLPIDDSDAAPLGGSGGELLFRLEMSARHAKALFAHQHPSAALTPNSDASAFGGQEAGIDPRKGQASQQILQQILADLASLPWPGASTNQTAAARQRQIREELLRTAAGRALFMPLPLKEPQELYFLILLGAIFKGAALLAHAEMVPAWLLLHPAEMQRLFDLAIESEKDKMPPHRVAELFLDVFKPLVQ